MKSILVLSSGDTDYTREANKAFTAGIEERLGPDFSLQVAHYNDIALSIDEHAIDAWLIDDQLSLSSFDLVYFKSFYRYSEQAKAVAEYCAAKGISYICHEIDDGISFSKLTQYARMARIGLPVIPTLYASRDRWHLMTDAVVQKLGFPFIFKATAGKGGDDNFLIHSREEWDHVLTSVENIEFIAQKFIPNDYDLRVLVALAEVKLVIKRQRLDDSTHLNNTSKGASATLIPVEEVEEEAREIALRAAAHFKRDIAGVDIMFEKTTGKAWILEVNASPQVATGAFTDEKLDVYAELLRRLLLT